MNRIGGTLPPLQNIIAFNERYGIAVADSGTTRNRIDPNSIFLNKGLGIDLGADGQPSASDPGDADTGPNEMQNAPTVVIALHNVLPCNFFEQCNEVRATGYLISRSNTEYVLDFYTTPANDIFGAAAGKKWFRRMTVTTDASGRAQIDEYGADIAPGGANAGEYLSMTVTDSLGNTSEFSNVQFINSQTFSSEPNDTIQTARQVTLEPGVFYRDFGTIGNRSVRESAGLDVDIMAITLGPRERVRIDLDKSNAEFDAVLRLFDASGQQLASSDNDAGFGETLSNEPFIDYTVAIAGTYYIGISGKGNETYNPGDPSSRLAGSYGRYTFDILSFGANTGPQPLDEPNDTIETALVTGLNSVEQGRYVGLGMIGDNPNIPPSLDVDLFTFESIPGQRIRFKIDMIDGSRVDARVFNSEGVTIFEPDLFSSPGSGFDSSLVFDFTAPSDCHPFFGCPSFPEPQTYILGFSHSENSSYDPLVAGSGTPASSNNIVLGSYVVRIVYPEPNDVIAEAFDTGLSSANPGRFQGTFEIGDNRFGPSDVDLYSLHLDAGERVKIDIDADSFSGVDAVLRMFNSLGEEVAIVSSGAGPSEMDNFRDPNLVFIATLAGTYYVGVSSEENKLYDPFREFSGFAVSGGSYDLEIRVGNELKIEPNDTILDAVDTELSSSNPGTYLSSGMVGDGGPFNLSDVDMLKVQSSNDNPAPGEPATADSYVDFIAAVAGEYYIGISANENDSYDPFNQGSGDWSFVTLGEYEIEITLSSGLDLQSSSARPARVTETEFLDQDVAQGVIVIDLDADGVGWFIDSTPLDHTEFSIPLAASVLAAGPGSTASNRYDLLTVLLHEMGHVFGFTDDSPGFASHVTKLADGRTQFVGPTFIAAINADRDHLDAAVYAFDLMNATLAPGERRLPSALDVMILTMAHDASSGMAASSSPPAFATGLFGQPMTIAKDEWLQWKPETTAGEKANLWAPTPITTSASPFFTLIAIFLGDNFAMFSTGLGLSGDQHWSNDVVDRAESSAATAIDGLRFVSKQETDANQDCLSCECERIEPLLSLRILDELFNSLAWLEDESI